MVLGHRELCGLVERTEQALRVDHHCSYEANLSSSSWIRSARSACGLAM
jgi:hypothetical protein